MIFTVVIVAQSAENIEVKEAPTVVDTRADARWRALLAERGMDADDLWTGGYVDYQWRHERPFFEPHFAAGDRVLEFGCNFGATSVMLAALGAQVAAVDVNEGYVELARLNAARYGLADRIEFHHVPDTRTLPFPDGAFGLVTACSVLEYVPHDIRNAVIGEIGRVVAPGGQVIITGTSSRLWPREVHSRRWFVNWMPRAFDRLFGREFQRGACPLSVVRAFSGFSNRDRADLGRAHLEARRKAGQGGLKIALLRCAGWVAWPFGYSAGMLTPSFVARLRKRDSA